MAQPHLWPWQLTTPDLPPLPPLCTHLQSPSLRQQRTHLSFQPASGVMEPDANVDVQVTCYGVADGQHRSIVKVRDHLFYGQVVCDTWCTTCVAGQSQ